MSESQEIWRVFEDDRFDESKLSDEDKQRLKAILVPCMEPQEIVPGVYLGPGEFEFDYDWLDRHQITHVINIGGPLNEDLADQVVYYYRDLEDADHVNIRSIFEETSQVIDDAVRNNGNIFIHCVAGISRSATIVCSYIMQELGLDVEDAMDLINRVRPCAAPNPGFLKQLQQYQRELGIESRPRPQKVVKPFCPSCLL